MKESRPRLTLKAGKEQSLLRFHPWVFSGAIQEVSGKPEEGTLVDVHARDGRFLGCGHYQPGSIAVRILSFQPLEDSQEFWDEKLASAYRLRKQIGLLEDERTTVFRLVNAEGDGLPGLVIDLYNSTAVLQIHSVGMHLKRKAILEALKKLLGEKLQAVYDKSSLTLPYKAKIEQSDSYLFGENPGETILENGNRFYVNWEEGQKTGFFIDQRENRALMSRYSKSRRVLNAFCYTGGFSVYALAGGAEFVHSFDSSASAMALTERNIDLNFPGDKRHTSFTEDAGRFFRNPPETYDMIILDPPAFAKHIKVLENALQGYKRLNARALELISPGGVLFTFSCSQVVSRENFRKSIFAAAANVNRRVRILHQLSQPPDHPVSIFHPEGEYLKGLVLQVE